jgi:hypothetical protein
MNRFFLLAAAGLAATVCSIRAADPPASTPPSNEPRGIPLTRPEMKQFLEDMKQRKPRIPLPELTEEEKTKLGERGTGYESRLRFHYLPEGSGGFSGGFGGFSGGRPAGGTPGAGGNTDPAMTLDNTFKTELFWIVCRMNNCQYCQGHQESKLLRGGRTEDQIAALDGDWSGVSAKERAAFGFARKITYEPHLFNDADIKTLQEHYSDLQIIEMLLSIAGNNSINRWKEGTGVPQSEGGGGFGRAPGTEPKKEEVKHTYLTPTSEKYQKSITKLAPVKLDEKGQPTRQTVSTRPPLESREEVEKALAAARTRTPRLKLADAEKVKAALPEGYEGAAPQWAQLQAHFSSAKGRIAGQIGADKKGDLTPLMKAQVSWIIARQDRAWYATEDARLRLKAAGQTDDQIYALDGDWKGFSDADRAMFTLAKKLAASPVVLTDDDVALTVKLSGPKLTTQMISYVTTRASFDRITEAAGLTAGK